MYLGTEPERDTLHNKLSTTNLYLTVCFHIFLNFSKVSILWLRSFFFTALLLQKNGLCLILIFKYLL